MLVLYLLRFTRDAMLAYRYILSSIVFLLTRITELYCEREDSLASALSRQSATSLEAHALEAHYAPRGLMRRRVSPLDGFRRSCFPLFLGQSSTRRELSSAMFREVAGLHIEALTSSRTPAGVSYRNAHAVTAIYSNSPPFVLPSRHWRHVA